MKNEQTIKDYYGRILGYIKEETNGDKSAYDFYRRKLGTYDKKKNITRDFYGKILASGDILTSLIYQEENKKNDKKDNKQNKI